MIIVQFSINQLWHILCVSFVRCEMYRLWHNLLLLLESMHVNFVFILELLTQMSHTNSQRYDDLWHFNFVSLQYMAIYVVIFPP